MSGHDWNPHDDEHDDSGEESPLTHVDYGSAASAEPPPSRHRSEETEPEPEPSEEEDEENAEDESESDSGSPRRKFALKPGKVNLAAIKTVKRETRVGFAAMLSFVILMGAFIGNRGKKADPTPRPRQGTASGTPVAINFDPNKEVSSPKIPETPSRDAEDDKEKPAPTPTGEGSPPGMPSRDPDPSAVKQAAAEAVAPPDDLPPPSEKNKDEGKKPEAPPESSKDAPPPSTAPKDEKKPETPPPSAETPTPPNAEPKTETPPTPPGDAPKTDAPKPDAGKPEPPKTDELPGLPDLPPSADAPKPGENKPPAGDKPALAATSEPPKGGDPPSLDTPKPAEPPKTGDTGLPDIKPGDAPKIDPKPSEPPKTGDLVPPMGPAPAADAKGKPPELDAPKPPDQPPALDPAASPKPSDAKPSGEPSALPKIGAIAAPVAAGVAAGKIIEGEPKPLPINPGHPATTGGPSTSTPSTPAPMEPAPASVPQPAPIETPPANAPQPAPVEAPAASSMPSPAPASTPAAAPGIVSTPSPAIAPAAAAAAVAVPAARALEPGFKPIRNLGKKKILDVTESEIERPTPKQEIPDAPPPRVEPKRQDDEPVLHTVGRGENFWTISRLYYGSGRYYKALWSYNSRSVPKIAELYVGTTIKVPPPELLDSSLIEPPSAGTSRSTKAPETAPRTSRVSRPRDDDPASNAGSGRRAVDPDLSIRKPSRADEDRVDPPLRPTYRVQAHDTLRGIAKQTLGDSRRDREILELNRDTITDPRRLTPGQVLILPEDASVGTRVR